MAYIAEKGVSLSDSIDDYPEGIIIPIDKPYRWTSADVIRKIKYTAIKHFGKKNLKVGHAGTLDPLATGVLLVCIGKATKLAEDLQKKDKEYIAGISFGATTASFDREKEIDSRYPTDKVSLENLESVLPDFIGEQEQVAPLFSAKSVDGVRAYEIARKEWKESVKEGKIFDHSSAELLSRQRINISFIKVLSFGKSLEREEAAVTGAGSRINVVDISEEQLPRAEIIVSCSKGTYIRALARDIGEALDSGAFLDSLRRTKNGGFQVDNALTMEEAMGILSKQCTE